MCYDIERVVENADFTTDKIYEYIFDPRIITGTEELEKKEEYEKKQFRKFFVPREGLTDSSFLEETNKIRIYSGNAIIFDEGITNDGNGRKVKYHSKRLLYGCKVPNPSTKGANGLQFPITSELRIVVGSGKLSSCSYAVLRSDKRLYVIHAGAYSVNSQGIDCYKTHCETLNKDIFNAFVSLEDQISGESSQLLTDGLDDATLAQKLAEHRASGIIVSHALPMEDKQIPKEPISFDTTKYKSYTTRFIKYANEARVYVIKNENGKTSCLVRKASEDRCVWFTAMFDNIEC